MGEADTGRHPGAADVEAGLAMPFSADFVRDPGSVWTRLRADGPVHRLATPDGPSAWFVVGFDDVHAGLLDPRLSVEKRHATGGDYTGFSLPPALDAHLLNSEPPAHTRLRELVASAMHPRRLEVFEPRLQAAADDLVAAIARRGGGDLVAGLAAPLPLALLGDLLGIPARQRSTLTAWAKQVLSPDPQRAPRARDTLGTMFEIVQDLIAGADPQSREGLLPLLVAARAAGRLSDDELTSMVFYLLFVWYEVSIDAIAGGLLTLLKHPDQLARLEQRPAVIGAAVEETLRYETPQLFAAPRFPTEDVAIGGVRIPAGDTVLLSLGAANRDPRRFSQGDSFDLTRATASHLSFGQGIHTCLGAPLARLLIATAIRTAVTQLPGLRLAVDAGSLGWRPGFRHRSLTALPITARPS